MSGKAFVFAVLLLISIPAHAENETVRRGPVPDWVTPSELMPVPADAAGLVFVRRSDRLIHLDGQGQAEYLGYRIKVLHPNALQLGNLALSWNPAAGAATVHAVRIYRDGAVIDVLQGNQFEILRREDQLEAASINGILTAVLRVPDLRVGDEIEFQATIRSNDPSMGGKEAGLLALAPSPPPGRFRFALSWSDGQEPHLAMTPDLSAIAVRHPREVSFTFDNPAMLSPPNEAPPRYLWQRVAEYSDFPDWAAISSHFAPLFATAATLAPNSPLREEARRIAAAHARPLERAAAALKLVQQEVRYVYVGLNGGNLTPAAADLTWQRRYGDCKGKTVLLLALLRELGIEAEPVLVNNAGGDDGLDSHLPNPGMFDHVLVRARIEGSNYWLDGTLPPVAEPATLPLMPYRWVLPLAAQGRPIERLAWHAPVVPEEMTLQQIDARAGFDRPAQITLTTVVRGLAGLQQQAQLSGLTQPQLLSAFRQNAVGDLFQSIADVQWRYDPAARASILTIVGTGTVNWEDEGAGVKALSLPGGGFNPPERRVRPADQDQNAPYYSQPSFSCFVTTVRLPESTPVSHWSFNTSFDTRMFGRDYHRAFEMRGGAIRMIRGSRVEQPEIDSATAVRDNARIAAFDNSMARISYDPAHAGASGANGRHVPATYEIDPAAGNVPCLAPDAVDR